MSASHPLAGERVEYGAAQKGEAYGDEQNIKHGSVSGSGWEIRKDA